MISIERLLVWSVRITRKIEMRSRIVHFPMKPTINRIWSVKDRRLESSNRTMPFWFSQTISWSHFTEESQRRNFPLPYDTLDVIVDKTMRIGGCRCSHDYVYGVHVDFDLSITDESWDKDQQKTRLSSKCSFWSCDPSTWSKKTRLGIGTTITTQDRKRKQTMFYFSAALFSLAETSDQSG